MWSADSQHLVHYARNGHDTIMVLDGRKLAKGFYPPGIPLEVLVDDQGRQVGMGMMGTSGPDPAAVAQAVLTYDVSRCDPFTTSLLGKTLTCIEKQGKQAWMKIGSKREVGYRSIRTVLPSISDYSHYAYVVETDRGRQVVIDGVVNSHAYSAIYRVILDQQNNSLVFLAIKAGELIRVVQPLEP